MALTLLEEITATYGGLPEKEREAVAADAMAATALELK